MWGVLFRVVVAIIIGIGGWQLGKFIGGRTNTSTELTWIITLAIGGYISGYLLAPLLTIRPWRWLRKRIRLVPRVMPFPSIVAAAIGLAFALVITALATLPLSLLPEPWGKWSPLILGVFLCVLFIPIMVLQGPAALRFFFSAAPNVPPPRDNRNDLLILDTNDVFHL